GEFDNGYVWNLNLRPFTALAQMFDLPIGKRRPFREATVLQAQNLGWQISGTRIWPFLVFHNQSHPFRHRRSWKWKRNAWQYSIEMKRLPAWLQVPYKIRTHPLRLRECFPALATPLL